MTRFIKSTTGAIIGLNLLMFVALRLCLHLWGDGAAAWLGVRWPCPWPWTPLTAMFTQVSVADLFFNMLWFWCTAVIFRIVGSPRRLLTAYLCGGFAGALFFIGTSAVGLCSGTLFGASAAVLSVMCCAASMAPRMPVSLLFFGEVRLLWIAAVMAALSLLAFAMGNIGGGFAHLGGIAAGAVLGLWSKGRTFSRRSFIRPEEAMTLDELLDKVRRSGYSSLSPSERKRLLEIGKKL